MGDDIGSEESPSAAVGGVTRSAFEQERQRMKQEHILKEQATKAAAQVSSRCQPCYQRHTALLPAVLLSDTKAAALACQLAEQFRPCL